MIRCSQCGEEHDIFSIEPRYGRPDAYLQIPAEERKDRTSAATIGAACETRLVATSSFSYG